MRASGKGKTDIALLVLRLGIGSMMFHHGYEKFQMIGTPAGDEVAAKFLDFLGLGPSASFALAALGEGGGGVLVMLGLFTRLGAFGAAFTMLIAITMVHWDDPVFAHGGRAKEMALLYLVPFLALLVSGAGAISFDRRIAKRFPRLAGVLGQNLPASGSA